jgi:hypothetical protein
MHDATVRARWRLSINVPKSWRNRGDLDTEDPQAVRAQGDPGSDV